MYLHNVVNVLIYYYNYKSLCKAKYLQFNTNKMDTILI